jgi:hypothetical protein
MNVVTVEQCCGARAVNAVSFSLFQSVSESEPLKNGRIEVGAA